MVELVVLLRRDGTAADRRRTIDALERTTPDLEICLCDPNAAAARSTIEVAVARGHQVLVIGSASGAVTDQVAWDAVHRAPDSDVVLLEVGGVVGPEWREQLRSAAYAETVIGTASAIPADMLSLYAPSREPSPLPGDRLTRGTALGEPLWGCVYIRRDALEVAKGARWLTDNRPDGLAPRLEDFVLVPGLVHVLATTIASAAVERPQQRPSYVLTPGVRRALAEVEAAIEPLRVTVDLRCCAFPLSGTQVHALNLVASLGKRDELRLSVLLPANSHESVRPHLDALPTAITRHTEGSPLAPAPHVFHRPYQVLIESEIADVVTAGARLVITHQDMILDRTPSYFESRDQWRHYTAATGVTLVAADEVVFFSEHARQEAIRDGLVDGAKTSVVPPGTDHLGDSGGESVPPALTNRLGTKGSPFLLVMGNAYLHKNRLFALRVAEELRRSHGWQGITLFAGDHPGHGSSRVEEGKFLRDHDELSASFVELPRVTDAERRWLYRHASLVLFPTLYEGFGLIPFEAGAAGTPCVYSSRSSVAEYLPPEGALLDLADVGETARRLHTVLEGREAGETIVRAVRHAGSELTWARAADAYAAVYRRAMTKSSGLSLVSGREVVVGARALMVTSETERRILVLLRRSAAVRGLAGAIINGTAAARRAAQRLPRP